MDTFVGFRFTSADDELLIRAVAHYRQLTLGNFIRRAAGLKLRKPERVVPEVTLNTGRGYSLRVDALEQATLKAAAHNASMSLSDYVRQASLQAAQTEVAKLTPEIMEEYALQQIRQDPLYGIVAAAHKSEDQP